MVGGLAALASPWPGSTAFGAAVVTQPLVLRAGKLFTPVTLNGKSANAILDTGSARSSIDLNFAQSAGVQGGRRFTGVMIQGRVQGVYAKNAVLGIGGQTLPLNDAVVVDYGQFSRELGAPVEVVLGREVFEAFVVDLDFEQGRVSFSPRAGYTPPEGAHPLALRPAGGRMTAVIEVEDLPIRAALDIGNDVPLILSPSPKARRLLSGRSTSTALIGGEGSNVIAQTATAHALTFAGFTVANVPFQAAPRPIGFEANLGLPVLGRFRLILDFGGKQMWLLPGASLPAAFDKDRTGLNGYVDGAGRLRILHVAKGGPGEKAGLKAGDVVTAIDGVPAAQANAALTGAAAGRTLELTLADGSQRRLTLADYF